MECDGTDGHNQFMSSPKLCPPEQRKGRPQSHHPLAPWSSCRCFAPGPDTTQVPFAPQISHDQSKDVKGKHEGIHSAAAAASLTRASKTYNWIVNCPCCLVSTFELPHESQRSISICKILWRRGFGRGLIEQDSVRSSRVAACKPFCRNVIECYEYCSVLCYSCL